MRTCASRSVTSSHSRRSELRHGHVEVPTDGVKLGGMPWPSDGCPGERVVYARSAEIIEERAPEARTSCLSGSSKAQWCGRPCPRGLRRLRALGCRGPHCYESK